MTTEAHQNTGRVSTGQLLIVGGSDAGISVALRAKEIYPAAQVTVAVADRYPNYTSAGYPTS